MSMLKRTRFTNCPQLKLELAEIIFSAKHAKLWAWILCGILSFDARSESIRASDDCLFLWISGPINRDTPALLSRTLESPACQVQKQELTPGSNGPVVWLNSLGGDVDAAMLVGRILRMWQSRVYIDEKEQCASACVLALLGGIDRAPIGALGLHRPYSTAMPSSTSDASGEYQRMRTKVEVYMKEMNIPLRLLDVMSAIGPQEIRWLHWKHDEKELEELWISGRDPVWEDLALTKLAKEKNISKQELIERAHRARTQCGDLGERWSAVDFAARDNCRRQIIDEGKK